MKMKFRSEPPGRPTGLRATDVRSRSAIVSWDEYPPSSGVQTIVLEHKKTTGDESDANSVRSTIRNSAKTNFFPDDWDEKKSATTEVAANEAEGALSPLQPATSYTVRAYARNHLGLSLASEELIFLTMVRAFAFVRLFESLNSY